MDLEDGIRHWDKLAEKVKSLEAIIADEPEGFSPLKRIRHALATTKLQDVQYDIKKLKRELAEACDRAIEASGVPEFSLAETMKSAQRYQGLADRAWEVASACRAAANMETIDGIANKPLSALASKSETKRAKREVEAFAKELERVDHRIRDGLFKSLEAINPRGDFLDVATVSGYFTSWENAGKLGEVAKTLRDFNKGMEARADEIRDDAWMIRRQIVRDEGLGGPLMEAVARVKGFGPVPAPAPRTAMNP